MDLSQLESLGTAGLIGASIGFLVFGFLSLLLSAVIVRFASNFSAGFKPTFWRTVLWLFVAGIFSALLGAVSQSVIVNLILGIVIAAVIFQLALRGPEGQRLSWGQAFIVSLIYTVAWFVIMMVVGIIAVLIVGAAA